MLLELATLEFLDDEMMAMHAWETALVKLCQGSCLLLCQLQGWFVTTIWSTAFFAFEAKSAVAGLLGGEIDGNGGLPVSVSVWSVWRDV